MITYKKVLKRYCPTREHNVEIEISRHKDGRITEKCLQESCEVEKCKVCGKAHLYDSEIKKEAVKNSLFFNAYRIL